MMNISHNTSVASHPPPWHVDPRSLGKVSVWVAVQLIAALLGVLLNASVIYAILHFKTLQSSMNYKILSLAVVSLLYDIFLLPAGAIGILVQWYDLRPAQWCTYYNPLSQWLISTQSYHVMVISINRFLAVVCPYVYRTLKTRKVTVFFVLPCWMLPFAVAIVGYSGVVGTYAGAPPFGYCLPVSEARALYLMIQTTMVYVPTAVMATCYAGIFIKFVQIERDVRRIQAATRSRVATVNQRRVLRKRIRASLAMFLCFVLFCLNYYPTSLLYLVVPRSVQWYPYLFLWLRSLVQTASLVNPVIYTCLDPKFRHALGFMLDHFKTNGQPCRLTISSDLQRSLRDAERPHCLQYM